MAIFVSYSSIFSNKTSCNAKNGRDFNEPRKIIEEDIQEAEELQDNALEVEKTLNNELEEARVKANDILRNCKDEIKRNTQEAIADIDIKIADLIKASEKNIISLKAESKKEVSNLSKKLAPEIVKLLIS